MGACNAFNPTGVVEPQRSPSAPSDRLGQNVGRTLVSMNAFFGKTSLTLVYLNDAQFESGAFHWGEHDYAMRAYTFLNGLDLSGILHMTCKHLRLRKGREGENAGVTTAADSLLLACSVPTRTEDLRVNCPTTLQ